MDEPRERWVRDERGQRWRVRVPAVARGGQSEVFPAEGPAGQQAALKLFFDPAVFRREQEQLRAVVESAPDADGWLMVPLSAGTFDGRSFLLFPWAEETLTEALKTDDIAVRVELLLAAAEAVHRFHRSNPHAAVERVHRDIKPSNFLVDAAGVVRLSDLGIARDTRHEEPDTNTIALTPRYAPPEQALPLPGGPREHWDVHALAVTIFQGLTKRIPMASLRVPLRLSGEGRDLRLLDEKRVLTGLSGEDQARWEALRRLPVSRLLEPDDGDAWAPEDDAALRQVLVERHPRAEPAVRRLADELSRALQHDPARRAESVRGLLVALKLVQACLRPPASSPTPPSPPPPAPAATPRLVAPRAAEPAAIVLSPAPAARGSRALPARSPAIVLLLAAVGCLPLLLLTGLGLSRWLPLGASVQGVQAVPAAAADAPAPAPSPAVVSAVASAASPPSALDTRAEVAASPATMPASTPNARTPTSSNPSSSNPISPNPSLPDPSPPNPSLPDPSPPTSPPAPSSPNASAVDARPASAAPPSEPAGASATLREVLLRTCPTGVALSVDGESVRAPGLTGTRVTLADGAHTIGFSHEGQRGSERVTVAEGMTGWCKDFLQSPDAGCGC